VNITKHLKHMKKRESLKMAYHLESLGAAFCKETGLTPSETSLVTATDDKGTHYYFTQKPDDFDVEGLHPTMRELVDLAAALNNAVQAKDEQAIAACHYGIAAYFAGLGK
jgi:hypothetical protein